MIIFPNAKINIGLNIVGKRTDGYHNLETVFYPIPFEDVLEVYESNNKKKPITLSVYGKSINGHPTDNLIIKAYNLLKKAYNLPPIDVHLYKNIPSGAGLGGGSSNAAFMLKALNNKFNLNLSVKKLENYAAKLGADCPFFIQNKPTFAEGIGEIFTPINLSLTNYRLVLIKPQIFISTKEAFRGITPYKTKSPLLDCIKLPIDRWKNYIVNDFEQQLSLNYPELNTIKKYLYESGAIYASMSGSGSSMYGIYSKKDTPLDLSCFHEYYIFDL